MNFTHLFIHSFIQRVQRSERFAWEKFVKLYWLKKRQWYRVVKREQQQTGGDIHSRELVDRYKHRLWHEDTLWKLQQCVQQTFKEKQHHTHNSEGIEDIWVEYDQQMKYRKRWVLARSHSFRISTSDITSQTTLNIQEWEITRKRKHNHSVKHTDVHILLPKW
jgi:hypothetical protein